MTKKLTYTCLRNRLLTLYGGIVLSRQTPRGYIRVQKAIARLTLTFTVFLVCVVTLVTPPYTDPLPQIGVAITHAALSGTVTLHTVWSTSCNKQSQK